MSKWTNVLLGAVFVLLAFVLIAGSHFDWQSHNGKTRINFQIGGGDSVSLNTPSVIVLVLGIAFLSAAVLGRVPNGKRPPSASFFRRLTTSNKDCWVGGVCGGLGTHTPLPSWLWRLAFAILIFAYGTGLLAYLVLWIFIPAERSESEEPPGSSAVGT